MRLWVRWRFVALCDTVERRGRNAGGLKHPPLLGALDGFGIEGTRGGGGGG